MSDVAFRARCTECDWTVCYSERRDTLRAALFHFIGSGHVVDEQEALEEEYNV